MPAEKILLLKGKAGLGNRLLVLLDSLLYAERTGRRLVVDWRDRGYSTGGENAFAHYFEAPEAGDPRAWQDSLSVTPTAWFGHLDKTIDELLHHYYPDNDDADEETFVRRLTSADTRRDWPETVAVRWGWTHELANLRLSEDHDSILRATLRERVRPSARVRQRVDTVKALFAGPAIGLHVRFSDRQNPYQGYRRHVDAFLAEHPAAAVFLATDNQEVEAWFRATYRRVFTLAKWFPPAGVPIHRNREARDIVQAGVDALADLYSLGACDALVYNSTSTFGHVASLISAAHPRWRIDTAPYSWRRSARRVRDYVHARRS